MRPVQGIHHGITHLVALLMFSGLCSAQSLVEQDLAYGLTFHNRVMASNNAITSGPMHEKLRVIFTNLVNTPLVQQGPPLPYSLFYLARPDANAASGAGGRLYVTDGLTRVTNGDDGMLAFAIGHEVAHSLQQHVVKKFLREIEYEQMLLWYRRRIAYGDKRANWEMIGYVTAHGIAERKIERDEENKADLVGLQIAAQAGYHPDFAIQLTHAMRNQHKDQSKFMAFFSDHPRWATREERITKNYDVALNAFSARWPMVAQSPGGVPPQIAAYRASTAPAPVPEPRNAAGSSNGATPALSSSRSVAAPANGLVNVTFTSSPPGALVSFSGMAVGYTPCVIKLEARWYRVKMKLSGFADWAGEITVEAGKPSTVVAQMERSQ
jgi:Zn-dependent protease with chaperone function